MKRKINHAIIGCGRIAQNHYNAATENGMNIISCCDRKLAKAKAFAEKNNINFSQLLQDALFSYSLSFIK